MLKTFCAIIYVGMYILGILFNLYCSSLVMQRLNVKHDSYNILPEQVCGIHVQSEGSSCCNNQPTYPLLG